MICMQNEYGTIKLSQAYFATLVGQVASTCFGVAGMCGSAAQGLRRALSHQEIPDKGVRVRGGKNGLLIELHIQVVYGVNLTAITKSIAHKVRYVVEKRTGFRVDGVRVVVGRMLVGAQDGD